MPTIEEEVQTKERIKMEEVVMSSKANPWNQPKSKNPFDDPVTHELFCIVLELKAMMYNSEGREEMRRRYDKNIELVFARLDRVIAKTKE